MLLSIMVRLSSDKIHYNTYLRCYESAKNDNSLALKKKVLKSDWDNKPKNRLVRDREADAYLSKALNTGNSIIEKYRVLEKKINFQIFKDEFTLVFFQKKKANAVTVIEEWNKLDLKHSAIYARKNFELFAPKMRLDELDEQVGENFKKFLIERNLKKSTINSYLMTFNTFVQSLKSVERFKIAMEKKDKDISKKVYLTADEVKLIYNAYLTEKEQKGVYKSRHVLFFVAICYTGMAFVDVSKLKISDIQSVNDLLVINKLRQKSKVEFITTVPLFLFQEFKLLVQSDDEIIFKKVEKTILNRKIQAVCENLSIDKHISSHKGRHTFATLAIQEHREYAILAKQLGHSSIKQSEHYGQLQKDAVVDFLNKQQQNTKISFQERFFAEVQKLNITLSESEKNAVEQVQKLAQRLNIVIEIKG